MNDATKGGILLGALLALGIAVGLGIGWKLWKPKPAPVETAAPPVRQKDGSQVLERRPMPAAEANRLVPLPVIPKGGVVERRMQVVVQPNTGPGSSAPLSASGVSVPGETGAAAQTTAEVRSPPIRVDLALVRMPDQTRRVIASSPDGQVIGGVDIPEAPTRPEPKVLRWAGGLDYTVLPWGNVKSLVIQRTWGPLTVGAHAGLATIVPPGGGQLQGGAIGVTALIRW